MSALIINAKDFSPSKNMIFTKPKANKSGGKSVGILNSVSKKSLMVQTPLMMNWGVNVYDNDNGTKSYDFTLQFPREEFGNDETKQLLDMMVELEDKVKADALKNSRDWFGKASMLPEVIDALWSPMLKYPKDQATGEPDKTRSPTLKVKFPYYENEFKFELFDVEQKTLIPNDEQRGPDEFIQKGSNIACILQCGGLWFANGKFGITWRLFQGVVKPLDSLERGKCHITLSAPAVCEPGMEEVVATKPVNTYDSDGETEEPLQQEPQPEEPVTEKKPKGKKK